MLIRGTAIAKVKFRIRHGVVFGVIDICLVWVRICLGLQLCLAVYIGLGLGWNFGSVHVLGLSSS